MHKHTRNLKVVFVRPTVRRARLVLLRCSGQSVSWRRPSRQPTQIAGGCPKAKDGRPPTRMGRLAIVNQLHRARLVHHRDGRPRKALLCLEIK